MITANVGLHPEEGKDKKDNQTYPTFQMNCGMKLESLCPERNPLKQRPTSHTSYLGCDYNHVPIDSIVGRQFFTTARRFFRKRVETIAKANDKTGNETKTFQFNIGCREKNKKNMITGYFIRMFRGLPVTPAEIICMLVISKDIPISIPANASPIPG